MSPRQVAATAVAFLLTAGLAAAAPHATSGGSLPTSAGFPESITTAPTGKTYYVSSFTTGAIYKGTVGAAAHLFLAAGGNARTSATGVKLDRHGRLYVLTGSGSHLQVFNARSGRLEANLGAGVLPGQNLNDLAITPNGDIYITDFTTPRIYRVKASAIARGRGKISAWLTPKTSTVPSLTTGNLNGIALTGDERYLIVGQTGDGALYRIGLSNRSIHRIDVHGADLTGSDGILLIGHTLYVVRHSNAVAVLRLNAGYTSGRVSRTITDPSLDLPTSIAAAGKRLLITNALEQSGATSFQITSIPAPRHLTHHTQSVVAGGCRVQANATVSPGLTLTSHAFRYHYRGKLNLCVYTGKGAAKGGTISAGEPITIRGHRYQEPAPTGTGTCLGTAAQGYDFARWKNGTQTIVQFSTTSSNGGPTHLTGSVIPSLQLQAINPSAGAPKTITFKTTNFVGQNVVGLLSFHASDPSLCGKPRGVTSATVTGILGHVGLIGG